MRRPAVLAAALTLLAVGLPAAAPAAPAAPAGLDTNRLARQYERLQAWADRFPDKIGTIVYDEQAQRLVVKVGQSAAAQALRQSTPLLAGDDAVPVTFAVAATSRAQLRAARDFRSWAGDLAGSINHVTVDEPRERVIVLVDDRVAEVTARAEAALGFTPEVYIGRMLPVSRRFDTPSYYGGIPLWYGPQSSPATAEADCTLGFKLKKSNGTTWTSTAGHCGPNETHYWHNAGNSIARVSGNYYPGSTVDVAILGADPGASWSSRIWLGGKDGSRSVPVTAVQSTYLPSGAGVYFSGADGGQVYGTISNPQTYCGQFETVEVYTGWGYPVYPGDSGGPVVRWNTSTSATDDVVAVGMIECAGGIYVNGSWLYNGYAHFTPIHRIQQTLNATVALE